MICWDGIAIGLDQEGRHKVQAGGDERITALVRSILGGGENSREFAGRHACSKMAARDAASGRGRQELRGSTLAVAE
jgi:hypothetical protein